MNKAQYIQAVREETTKVKKLVPMDYSLKKPELDHIVPASKGFDFGIPINIMSGLDNLAYIEREDNKIKSDSLTEESMLILEKWFQEGKIDRLPGQEIDLTHDFDFDSMLEEHKDEKMWMVRIPLKAALSVPEIFCQRNTELRWEKTRRAMGSKFLITHAEMGFVVYPDGSIQRDDGNTRSYIFRNDLTVDGYEVPEYIYAKFKRVESKEEAEAIYHSIDSKITAETLADKMSALVRDRKLPRKWMQGSGLYEIQMMALENYKDINPKVTGKDEEKVAKVKDNLDEWIEQLLIIGDMLDTNGNLKKQVNMTTVGMSIKYLLKYKNTPFQGEVERILKKMFDNIQKKNYTPWIRFGDVYDNMNIMLDELSTRKDNEGANPHVKGVNPVFNSMITGEKPESNNDADRRLCGGWFIYCMDKTLADEKVDEDLVKELTGSSLTDVQSHNDALLREAKQKIMEIYDNFWG